MYLHVKMFSETLSPQSNTKPNHLATKSPISLQIHSLALDEHENRKAKGNKS